MSWTEISSTKLLKTSVYKFAWGVFEVGFHSWSRLPANLIDACDFPFFFFF